MISMCHTPRKRILRDESLLEAVLRLRALTVLYYYYVRHGIKVDPSSGKGTEGDAFKQLY